MLAHGSLFRNNPFEGPQIAQRQRFRPVSEHRRFYSDWRPPVVRLLPSPPDKKLFDTASKMLAYKNIPISFERETGMVLRLNEGKLIRII